MGEDRNPPDADGSNLDGQETLPPGTFETRLDAVAEAVEAAETEAALDTAESSLDTVAADLDNATLSPPEADDTGDAEPRAALTDRVDGLRDRLDDQRGPFAGDVLDHLDSAIERLTTNEWTAEGRADVTAAVERFVGTAGGIVTVDTGGEEPLAARLSAASEAIESANLHPDSDAGAIASLLQAAGDLDDALAEAAVFGDLAVREQLERRGFYDVLTPETRRDFPPEWNAIKRYEARGEVEPILLALETFDSEFMQENALDALEHIAPEEALDAVLALAEQRDRQPVRVLGRIGDERACDTLHGFLGGRDVELEKTTLWALGCIGSDRSTEPVAQRLAADDPAVRSAAARSLGLLGDTRAIDPLADRLAGDGDERVRASAAWALNQIGTGRALDVVANYADDRSYLVQTEAEKAAGV